MTTPATTEPIPEGLTEVLRESLKELRNISSQLERQNEGIGEIKEMVCRRRGDEEGDTSAKWKGKGKEVAAETSGSAMEDVQESVNPGEATSLSVVKPSGEEYCFWAIDERFFSQRLPPAYLDAILAKYHWGMTWGPRPALWDNSYANHGVINVEWNTQSALVCCWELPWDDRIQLGPIDTIFPGDKVSASKVEDYIVRFGKLLDQLEQFKFVGYETGLWVTDHLHKEAKVSYDLRPSMLSYIPWGRKPASLLWNLKGFRGDSTVQLIHEHVECQRLKKTAKYGPTAPWRRVIVVKGMPRLCPQHRPIGYALFQAAPERVAYAINDHIQCNRYQSMESEEARFDFQITFYEILIIDEDETDLKLLQQRFGAWRLGKIHNDKNEPDNKVRRVKRILRRSAYTIISAKGYKGAESEYWTMLVMVPDSIQGMADTYRKDFYCDSEKAVDRNVMVALSNVIGRAVKVVMEIWQSLSNYFDAILNETNALLNPEEHDTLLINDAKFSKSKQYFWAINILKEIKPHFRPPKGPIKHMRQQLIKDNLSPVRDELKAFQNKFHEQRELAISLRDGLFNASSVMETRASTRLDENIKLLTFVSIFFLPLSFTLSLWSVNSELPHFHLLPIIGTLLTLVTYFVVFNLNNIVCLINKSIRGTKNRIISHMKTSPDETWKHIGEELAEPVLANEQNTTPSSWRIVQYAPKYFWGESLKVRNSPKYLWEKVRDVPGGIRMHLKKLCGKDDEDGEKNQQNHQNV